MAITFRVDDVPRAEVPPATRSLAEHLGEALVIGGDPALRVLDAPGVHPLLAAVHAAFAEHRPLVLSPDAIWLTIAQGVAQHVRLHAEALRPRLVRHLGRAALEVRHDGPLPADAAAWDPVIAAFRRAIAERVGEGRARLLTCDFTTTTAVDRVASEIVLMDAYSPYFDYVLACVCGIPELTLLGTVDDWRALRARVDVIAELDLGEWAASLAPIADQLVAAARGQPDVAFFQRLYKPKEAYGWERITGWVARLFPYLEREGRVDAPNPLLALPLDWEAPPSEGRWYDGPGIITDEVPAGPSTCALEVLDEILGTRTSLALDGGLMAVEVDAAGRLSPRAAFRVRRGEPTMGAVVDRLRADPRVTLEPVAPRPTGRAAWALEGMPGEVRALYDACGGARLCGGWRLRPLAEHHKIDVPSGELTRFLDLPDGTVVAYGLWSTPTFVRLRAAALVPREPPDGLDEWTGLPLEAPPPPRWRTTETCDRIPVVGPRLATLLGRALDSDGALDLPVTGLLVDALPPYARRGWTSSG